MDYTLLKTLEGQNDWLQKYIQYNPVLSILWTTNERSRK